MKSVSPVKRHQKQLNQNTHKIVIGILPLY
jgi:hypothetical protein